MKILIVMPLAQQRGGAEMALELLLEHGRGEAASWHVIFLVDGPMVRQARERGIPAYVIPAGRLREGPRFLAAVLRIAARARRERADLILSWMTIAQPYGSLAAALAGIPSLWYQHGLPIAKSWPDRLAAALPAAGVLTCSRAVAEAQARLRPRCPIRVVYPGVALDDFDPAALPPPFEARRRLGLPAEGPLIGIVGRLQRSKGMHVLVEALPSILGSFPDAQCVVVGGSHAAEAEYPAYLQGRIAALGLGERVHCVGWQRNIPEWMQAMDVIVSATDGEGFGMAIVEAMALGKPVVAGNTGGPAEILTEGVTGLLTGDAPALATAILRYLDDPAFARRIGAAARERALTFSTGQHVESLLAAIQGLLRESAVRCPGNLVRYQREQGVGDRGAERFGVRQSHAALSCSRVTTTLDRQDTGEKRHGTAALQSAPRPDPPHPAPSDTWPVRKLVACKGWWRRLRRDMNGKHGCQR